MTDDTGRTVFENLPPGEYSPQFRGWSHREWVSPTENPYQPPPSARLTDPDNHMVLEVEVHPGVPVTVSVDAGDGDPRSFRPVFRNLETGYELRAWMPRNGLVEKILALGLWEVRVEPNPGYLLVAAYRDRLPVPGSTVRLDLAAEPVPVDLTWQYRAPAHLTGIVTFDGPRQPMWVEATLVEGGEWLEDAERRGGSQFRTVTDGPDDEGYYEMVLPDGVWRVRPRSREEITSEPEEVVLTLGPGETGEADFHVRVSSTPSLGVEVMSPDGEPVEGAVVEATGGRRGDDAGDAAPVASAVTDDFGRARLMGLNAGEGYRIVAGHEDYLEGETILGDLELDGPERSRARVVLRPGGTLEVREIDRPETSPTTLLIRMEYLEELPNFRLHDPEVQKVKRLRQFTLDRSGKATASGFLPGDHLLSISTPEVLAAATRALVRRPGEPWSRELQVHFWGEETLEVEVKRVPAARVHLELVCSDGWPLPSAASVRVIRVDGLESEPVLDREDVVLRGKHKDRLEIGPLDEGVYTMAVRPQGFERWTWLYGTTDPEAADPIVVHEHDVAQGETVNLGGLAIECGPAIDLVPEIRGDLPLPPLEEIEVEARYLPLGEGSSTNPEQSRWRHARVTKRDGVVELRDFPRGTLRLRLTLTHPHFLPRPDPRWETEVELERGQYHRVHPRIEGLGGSIRVKGFDGFARLVGDGEVSPTVPLRSGTARFESLQPSPVDVELCSDETCDSPIRRWTEVQVVRGKETVLREGSPTPP